MIDSELRAQGFELIMVPHKEKWTNKSLLRHIRGLLNENVASAKAERRKVKIVFGASYMPFWRKSVRYELASFQKRVKTRGGELILADLPPSAYHKERGLKPDFVSQFGSTTLDWGPESGPFPIRRLSEPRTKHQSKPDPALSIHAQVFQYPDFHKEPSGG